MQPANVSLLTHFSPDHRLTCADVAAKERRKEYIVRRELFALESAGCLSSRRETVMTAKGSAAVVMYSLPVIEEPPKPAIEPIIQYTPLPEPIEPTRPICCGRGMNKRHRKWIQSLGTYIQSYQCPKCESRAVVPIEAPIPPAEPKVYRRKIIAPSCCGVSMRHYGGKGTKAGLTRYFRCLTCETRTTTVEGVTT